MDLSPIILFVYNRIDCTERVIEALSSNLLAEQSKLIVYCDGPKLDASAEDLVRIEEVRNVVSSIEGFKKVEIICRTENLGLANSIIDGVSTVMVKYGKAIVLEDDIVTSKGFLRYMNDALDAYQSSNKVFGVSGYCYPLRKEIKNETYFLPISSSWGWATWSDRWSKLRLDSALLLDEIRLNEMQKTMDFNGYPYYNMLLHQVAGKVDSWAIRFYATMVLENSLFLFPNKSLTENIGFGNNATHTKSKSNLFEKVRIGTSSIIVKELPLALDDNICNSIILKDGFLISRIKKIKSFLKC